MKKIISLTLILSFCGIYCIISCKHTNKETNNTISAQYEDIIKEATPQKPKSADIFIDASGSMKPYFTDGEIINAVSKIEGLMTDETDVYFLANPPKQYKGRIDQILGQVSKQPGLSATTFHDFFKKEGAQVDTTNKIVYLVTDGIMSIGNDGSTKMALIGLENRIKASLQGHTNLAAAVLRYTGHYKGPYYDQNNKPVAINQQRPFYIIALAQKQYITWLKAQKSEDLYNPAGELYLGLHDLEGHSKPTVVKSVSDNKIDPLQELQLTLDLPSCLYDLPNDAVQHAKVSNNGQIIGLPVTRQGNTLYLKIPFQTPGFSADAMGKYHTTVVLPNEIPGVWKNWSSDADTNGPDEDTTFGLEYLIGGMFKALEAKDTLLEVEFDYSNN